MVGFAPPFYPTAIFNRPLTSELGNLGSENELATSVRAMRIACRKFLDRISSDKDHEILMYGHQRNHWASWVFNDALGQMRGVFGIHIALLAAKYGLDVEDELATTGLTQFPEELRHCSHKIVLKYPYSA